MNQRRKAILRKIANYAIILLVVYFIAKIVLGPAGQFFFGLGSSFFMAGPKGWLMGIIWFAPLWTLLAWMGFEWWRENRSERKNNG